jgi:hypothetical protein
VGVLFLPMGISLHGNEEERKKRKIRREKKRIRNKNKKERNKKKEENKRKCRKGKEKRKERRKIDDYKKEFGAKNLFFL